MSDIGGVWRTVGGRRIFIKDGQDLATAMKESGKFGDNGRFAEVEIKRILEVVNKQNDLEKKLQQKSYDAYNKCSDDEIDALNAYSGSGYFDVSDYLDGKYDWELGDSMVKDLNNAISKFECDEEFTVYSGTKKNHYKGYKKNDIIDNNRFISSTTRLEIAEAFTEGEDSGMILKINCKKKCKGAYLGISSTMFSESEFLLSNTQKYKVIGTTTQVINSKNYEVLEVETYE